MTTQLLDTEIRYSRATKDYDIFIHGQIIGSAATYSQAELVRTQALANLDPADGIPGIDDNDPTAPIDPDPAPGRADVNWNSAPDAGRAIARQFHRDRSRFLNVLRELDRDAWRPLAECYAAYMSRFGKWIAPEHVLCVWAKAADHTISYPSRLDRIIEAADASAESYRSIP